MKSGRMGLRFYSRRGGMVRLCCSGDGLGRICVPELEEREPLCYGRALPGGLGLGLL